MAALTFLHTNDFHGKLDASRLPFLLRHRESANFYFDTGDCVKAGNLAVPLRPEPVWKLLAKAKCTASVPGNRESQVVEEGFRRKIEGVKHPLLCCNMRRKNGKLVLPPSLVVESNGIKVGVVGTMVAMVTEGMATKAMSQFLWDQPIPAAIEEGERLRGEVDLLIALTHIGHTNDRKLAEKSEVFDVILGGHSHTVIEEPELVGRTWICQGGSHGKFLGVYRWENGGLTGGLVPWEVSE